MKLYGDGGHAKVIKAFCALLPGALVAIGSNSTRRKVVSEVTEPFGIAIHPTAWVAPDVEIGEGTVVMAGAVIQPGTRIGKHVIVNTKASVDHDCEIGDFVHIGPGCTLCGSVKVSEGKMVPAGTVLYQGASW